MTQVPDIQHTSMKIVENNGRFASKGSHPHSTRKKGAFICYKGWPSTNECNNPG